MCYSGYVERYVDMLQWIWERYMDVLLQWICERYMDVLQWIWERYMDGLQVYM